MSGTHRAGIGIAVILLLLGGIFFFQGDASYFVTGSDLYNTNNEVGSVDEKERGDNKDTEESGHADEENEGEDDIEEPFVPLRVETPESVRALYITSWVAGTPSIRERVLSLVRETEVNSVVIDIKDETGRISFHVDDPYLQEIGSQEVRISDLRDLIYSLNSEGIYVIGRISIFQDPYLAALWPDKAVRTVSGDVWKDRKGLSWVDPGSTKVWEYVTAIGWEAYNAGFDELNYDYIRFPSDGRMDDMVLPISEDRVKSEVLEELSMYLHEAFRTAEDEDGMRPVISADVFGMVTTNYDDLGIGQVLEKLFPYYDYIAPMVYPSHYPPMWHGIQNPAEEPYQVVYRSLSAAVERAQAEATPIRTINAEPVGQAGDVEDAVAEEGDLEPDDGERLYTKEVYDASIIRPWLQDFDLGAVYTADMVRAQIQATYDAGIDSWMIWDPANRYTREAYELAE